MSRRRRGRPGWRWSMSSGDHMPVRIVCRRGAHGTFSVPAPKTVVGARALCEHRGGDGPLEPFHCASGDRGRRRGARAGRRGGGGRPGGRRGGWGAGAWRGGGGGGGGGGVAEGLALGGGFGGPWLVAVDATVGVVCVAVGLAAWLGRPDSRTGPALVAMGGLWYLGAFGYARDQRLVDLIGFPLQGWFDVLLVVLLLAVTQGGLRVRAAGVVVAGLVTAHAVLGLARLLLRPPNDITSCFCVPNRITGITDPGAYEAVVRTASVAEAGFA